MKSCLRQFTRFSIKRIPNVLDVVRSTRKTKQKCDFLKFFFVLQITDNGSFKDPIWRTCRMVYATVVKYCFGYCKIERSDSSVDLDGIRIKRPKVARIHRITDCHSNNAIYLIFFISYRRIGDLNEWPIWLYRSVIKILYILLSDVL